MKRVTSAAAGLLGAALLGGCAGPLTQSAITSNIVQEEAHNAYLVLNIARAYERMPMHFTQVNMVRAGPGGIGIGNPYVGLDIPFGGAASPYYTLRPSLEGVPNVDTASLVSQEFMRGLTAPVDARLLAYFASQGWPLPMLLYMFVGSVETYDSDGNLLHNLVNSPRNETFPVFSGLIDTIAGCRLVLSESASYEYFGESFAADKLNDIALVTTVKNAGLVPVQVGADGTATTAGGGKRSYRLAQVTREAGVKLDSYGPGTSGYAAAGNCAVDAPAQAAAPGTGTDTDTLQRIGKALATLSISVTGPGDKIQKQGKKPGGAKPSKATPEIAEARLVLRSTQSMIYYLGELSRYQNATGAERVEPVTIRTGKNKYGHFFRLRCCEPLTDAAVSVAYQGKRFNVARYSETPDGAPEDRSVQTLALLSLVYTLQNSSTEAPGISNVRVLNR
jgi:hypothetical protein